MAEFIAMIPPPLTPPLKGEGNLGHGSSPSPLRGGGGSIPALPSAAFPPRQDENPGALLLEAWPDRIARARGERGRFVLANGSGAAVDAADPLAAESWLVVADLIGKAQNARITAAAVVDEADIRAALVHRIEISRETAFDRERGAVRMRETERLGAVVLAERMLPAPTGADADCAILDAVRANGLALLGVTAPERM